MQAQQQPLAARMRPQQISEFVGQAHLLGNGKPITQALADGHLHSMILWGPPGTGKTTLARLLASKANALFTQLSAIMAGVKDIRQVVEQAQHSAQCMVLFIDEIHRFNKAQQDAFLPFVEDGTLTLIGATTENPAFALNNALLSRARVYVLEKLTETDLLALLHRVLLDKARGLGGLGLTIPEALQLPIVQACHGDARQLLNYLELLSSLWQSRGTASAVDEQLVREVLSNRHVDFDNKGDTFYDLISALHKSVRGSDPDAALYWLARMLVGGCDPQYIARRVLRMASEDIGNADPRALRIAIDAWDVLQRLGSPEGELALAQAVIYLACAAKSNACYVAFNQAWQDAKRYGQADVPNHLRNAPTQLAKQLGHAKKYRYAHDEPHAYAAGENYFPKEFKAHYYQPVARGLEQKIVEKLKFLQQLDQQALSKKETTC